MDKRKVFGTEEERVAELFLLGKGYQLIDRNFSTQMGEVDLIFKDKKELVFVEVKARRSLDYGYPEESVTKTKLNKIRKTVAAYLFARRHPADSPCRIDVVSILQLPGKPPEIAHLINVW